MGTKKPRRGERPGLWWEEWEATGTILGSGLEGIVGFAVVGDVADAVHGVFEEGGNGEDREANGRAGKRAGDGEDKTGGLTEEAK